MLMSPIAHLAPIVAPEALVTALALVTAWTLFLVYRRGWRQTPGRKRCRIVSFAIGAVAVLVVTSPPLEELAEDLVSVHMVQHVALLLIGAPAIALSRPGETMMRGLSVRNRKRLGQLRRLTRLTPATTSYLTRPIVVWLLYALGIWAWHGAVAYEFAIENEWAHILEHAVFVVAGLVFWSVVLVPGRSGVTVGFRILMLFTTAFHSVLLGALLTFSDVPWYSSYTEATSAMGLDPLADQRLAGLLMWIPGGLAYTGAAVWLLTRWLRGEDRRVEDGRRSIAAETGSHARSSRERP